MAGKGGGARVSDFFTENPNLNFFFFFFFGGGGWWRVGGEGGGLE